MINFTAAKLILLSVLLAFQIETLAQTAKTIDLPVGATQLLKYEQKYVNRNLDTNKIIALKNYQAKEFSPEGGLIFDVESYWLDADKLYVFESEKSEVPHGLTLKRTFKGKEQVLFMVHPESVDFYKDITKNALRGPVFKATATASSRTLMMWAVNNPNEVFFGKLSLNKEVAGVVRTIPKGEVARSVGMTQILESAERELPKNFKYLPEFFGVMPKGMDRGGMLLRSLPAEYQNGEKHLMPLFALYTKPKGTNKSPLQSMISRSHLSAADFVSQKILQPFAKQWVQLVVENGLAIEAHAQNVLVEIGKDGLITDTYVYRDFGGFNMDLSMRQSKNLAMPKNLPVIEGTNADYHQEFHNKAIVQSLYTYYEGGFLYGMAQELKRIGYKDLTYDKLTSILHQTIQTDFAKRGIKVNLRSFYPDLIRVIDSARQKVPVKLSCQFIFH